MTTIVETINGLLNTNAVIIQGTSGNGYINVVAQSSAVPTPVTGVTISSDNSNNFTITQTDGFRKSIALPTTANRVYTVPDTSADSNFIMSIGNQSISGTLSATNLSGTNTGDVTLGVVGAIPNTSGASLSGQVLTLQPADDTNPGILTAGAQNIGGSKTIWGTVTTTEDIVLPSSTTITEGNIKMGASKFIHAAGSANTFMGKDVANYSLTGSNNVSIGTNTATAMTTASRDVIIGSQTGGLLTTASDNVFIGHNAGSTATQCTNSIVIGQGAGSGNTTNDGNTIVGQGAGAAITSGASNIMIGKQAGSTLTTGSGNIYVNAAAGAIGESNTTRIGTSQTAAYMAGVLGSTPASPQMVTIGTGGQLGSQAIPSGGVTTALAIGSTPNANGITISGTNINLEPANASFGGVITTGTQTFAGDKTFNGSVTSNGNINVASDTNSYQIGGSPVVRVANGALYLGGQAGGSSNEFANTMVGSRAGVTLTTGSSNTIIGHDAGYNIRDAIANVIIGHLAGYNLQGSTSWQNVAIGNGSGCGTSTAQYNTTIGSDAGSGLTTGDSNTFVGYHAGSYVTNGSNNICIGSGPIGLPSESNTTRIGNGQTAAFMQGIKNQTIIGVSNLQLMTCDTSDRLRSGTPTAFSYTTHSLRITLSTGNITAVNPTFTSAGYVLSAGGIDFTGVIVMQIGKLVYVGVPAFTYDNASTSPAYFNLTFTPGIPVATHGYTQTGIVVYIGGVIQYAGDIRNQGTNLRCYVTNGGLFSTTGSGSPSPIAYTYFTT